MKRNILETMPDSSNQPVTQGEFVSTMSALKVDMDTMRAETNELRADVNEIKENMATKADLQVLRQEMAQMQETILRHFDMVMENIRIEHGARLTILEQRTGLRPV